MSGHGPAVVNRIQHLLINFMPSLILPIPNLIQRVGGMCILLERNLAGWGWVPVLRHGGSRTQIRTIKLVICHFVDWPGTDFFSSFHPLIRLSW